MKLSLKFSIAKFYNIQINTIHQSIKQLLFYIQWYICHIYIYNGIYVIYIYIHTHTMVYMSYITYIPLYIK